MERESWEEIGEGEADDVNASKGAGGGTGSFALSASAKPFSFNPGAKGFTPSWMAKSSPPAAPSPTAGNTATPQAATQKEEEASAPVEAATPVPPPPAKPMSAEPKEAEPEAADDEDAISAATKEMENISVENISAETAATVDTNVAEAAPTEEELAIMEEEDQREHLNIVFIGHVDAGKSTIGGQILFQTGCVDDRTIQKYEKEAKEKNRESWYMAYIMDTNDEERAKGKTVEIGRAHFETEKKRYTVLDAPGHKNYVPNMIGGASQADIGVLVIAARRGEFETGFDRGGQTREHAQLAKTLGVSKLIVAVNKMDEPTVQWSKDRWDEIQVKLTPFLKQCGYNPKRDVIWCPISGLKGTNIKDPVIKDVCDWYDGGSLFEILDGLDPIERDAKGPFRMPIMDKYRDLGTNIMGKCESGTVKKGDIMLLMPNRTEVKVQGVYREADEIRLGKPGENLRIRLSGVEEEDVHQGFVLSSKSQPIEPCSEIDAQLAVLELLEHKAIFTAGYTAVFHVHSATEECEVMELLGQIDPKTKKRKKGKCMFVKSRSIVDCRIQVAQPICVELFKNFSQLGRFTLRDEGKTIAIGKIIAKPDSDDFSKKKKKKKKPTA